MYTEGRDFFFSLRAHIMAIVIECLKKKNTYYDSHMEHGMGRITHAVLRSRKTLVLVTL